MMKTKYEIALKRSFNQVKRWRKAFYLYEDKVGAKDRFIKLIREELTESFEATNRSKSLDLYVDVVFFCLSSAIEEGLTFEDVAHWYMDDGYAPDSRKRTSWKNLGKELHEAVLTITEGDWRLVDILNHIMVGVRCIYENRITHEEFFKVFDLVYKNNMKKFWTYLEWRDSIYQTGLMTHRKGPRNLVVKDSRGKVMKPPGFVGVKL